MERTILDPTKASLRFRFIQKYPWESRKNFENMDEKFKKVSHINHPLIKKNYLLNSYYFVFLVFFFGVVSCFCIP